MSDYFTKYRAWADQNISDERKKSELVYAIDWMELNANHIDQALFATSDHPCIAFSTVINTLLNEAEQQKVTFQPIINWLVDNQKCPFGLQLKVKAFKHLRRCCHLLSPNMVQQLAELQITSYQSEFRSREFLYLDKFLADYRLSGRQ